MNDPYGQFKAEKYSGEYDRDLFIDHFSEQLRLVMGWASRWKIKDRFTKKQIARMVADEVEAQISFVDDLTETEAETVDRKEETETGSRK